MTFKELNKKEKMQYIYDYYRHYFYIIIFVTCVVVYFVVPIINDMKYETIFQLVIVDCNRNEVESLNRLEKDLLSEINSESSYDKVFIDVTKTSLKTDNNIVALTIAFSIASGNDIVICGEETYNKFEYVNSFQNWEMYLSEDEIQKYSEFIEGDKLLLNKSDKWNDYGLTTYKPVYAVILSEPTNPKNINAFINLVF